MYLKPIIVLLSATLLVTNLYSQEIERLKDSKILIRTGIEKYDQELYDEAITYFEQVAPSDTNYLWAAYEHALTLYAQKKHAESQKISRKVIKIDPSYADAYTCLANSLDDEGKKEEALQVYDNALEMFPYNHMLWLNKGVLYEQSEQYGKAYEIYAKIVEFNPMYPSPHLRMGLICLKEGRVSQGLLSLATFLMLEPSSGRSLNILSWMDRTASGGNTELGSAKSRKLPNEMEEIDFLVTNKVALNKKYKIDSPFTHSILKQLHLIATQLSEQPGEGVWWDMYAPFYKKVLSEDKFSEFSMYLMASNTDESVQKTINKKMSDVKAFRTWFLNEWYGQHKYTNVSGEKKIAFFYNSNALLALGEETTDGKITGDAVYFSERGARASMGKLNESSTKEGTWYFFNYNGDTMNIGEYANGKLNGFLKTYYENGQLQEDELYTDGKLNGQYYLYYPNGQINIDEIYKDGKADGIGKRYYADGSLLYEYTQNMAVLTGEFKQYWANGNLMDQKNYVDGKLQGERKQYHENGQVSYVQQYTNDQLDGEYLHYHPNGQLAIKGLVIKGSKGGEWIYYYPDGTISETGTFDENGKLNGKEEHFAFDGKLLATWEYQKGEAKSQKVYDAAGAVIYEAQQQKGRLTAKIYSDHRTLNREGDFTSDGMDGLWKFYFRAGPVSYEKNYKKDNLHGKFVSYFSNGAIEYELNYEDNMLYGPGKIYNDHGDLLREGMYHNDELWGLWTEYFPDSTRESTSYFSDGTKVGSSIDYYFNGNKMTRYVYDKNNIFLGYANYDTLGNLRDTVELPLGYGNATTNYPNGQQRWKGSYIKGEAHGDFIWFYPNGKKMTEGKYQLGKRTGKWKWYFPDGSIKEEGQYENDNKEGLWTLYYFGGTVSMTSNYLNDNLHGTRIKNTITGKKEYQVEFYEDSRHGPSSYYAPTGELKVIRYYNHGMLTGYTYQGKDGKLLAEIPLKNESGEILAYYPNGQKSVHYAVKNGNFQGDFYHYFPNGALLMKSYYENGNEHGESITYYAPEKLVSKENFRYGDYHGDQIYYFPNGKIQRTVSYRYDQAHGIHTYHALSGTSIYNLQYNTGDLITME